jgi:hypothetical protein
MNPTVRAKFRVDAIEQTRYNAHTDHPEILSTVKLSPVVSDSPENKEFFKWTPSGKIELGTVNAKAASAFDIGKEYYIDFTLA